MPRWAWGVLVSTCLVALGAVVMASRDDSPFAPGSAQSLPYFEPVTSSARPWSEVSATGRLRVSAGARVPSSILRVSQGAVSWEGYVREGETADIELVPGSYVLEVIPAAKPGQASGPASPPVHFRIATARTIVSLELQHGSR